MKVLAIPIALLCALACGASEQERVKISGGTAVDGEDHIKRYTAHVALHVAVGAADYRVSKCSGVLLTLRHVLLAAHCMVGTWRARVTLGYDEKISLVRGEKFSAQRRAVSYVSPRSYLNGANSMSFISRGALQVIIEKLLFFQSRSFILKDIALLELDKPFDLPYPIDYRIPPRSLDLSGKVAQLSGYGVGDSDQPSGRLRKAKVKIGKDFQRTDIFEFSDASKHINFGDSGGPVWWHDEQGQLHLIGVHALALPLLKYHSFATDIRHHQQWINNARQLLETRNAVITPAMDAIKRYLPGYTSDFYEAHHQD